VNDSDAVTGIAWYRQDQWTRLRELASDADKLEESYENWLAGAQKTLVQMKVAGVRAQRVDVDLDELARWCRAEGHALDSAARAAFVASRLRLAHEVTNGENV
jgi:hypothetical protein